MIKPPLCSGTDAKSFALTNLLPADKTMSRAGQTRDVLERMEAALQAEGMNFTHVVRTWFYLDDILDWYNEFNVVRTAFFREHDVFKHMVPASTGVGMANPAGAADMAGLIAVKPGSGQVKVFAVPSPLQCPALDYKSSFSRAAEVQVRDRRHLYISGTASIDVHGASVHPDDVDAQIHLSMNVVEAILKSRNMTWDDATRAVAYFKGLHDAARFPAYCMVHGLSGLKTTMVQADICREELLFEIELDAMTDRPT